MSNSNTPRTLKLKKRPKGIFNWKVTFYMQPGHRMGFYDRYCNDFVAVGPEIVEYLAHSTHGKYSLHTVDSDQFETDSKKVNKYDYVLFENQLDVSMFKLCHGHVIRRIYRIVTE